MLNSDIKLLSEFKTGINRYHLLEEKAVESINQVIKDNNFFIMQVMHRTKDADSLAGKLKRKNGKYKKLTDITDLVGIRVICYFSDTVDKIAEKLAEVFEVDWENSVDKRAALDPTQFGYLSLHYICSFSEKDDCDESIKGIPFEIQIRTVLQHAWAEIEHDMGYKSAFGVPRAIMREYSQTAGLLEVADRQFVEIRDNSFAYEKSIREQITAGDADGIYLDRISLREYLRINKDIVAFVNKLKQELGVEVEETEPDSFLEQLNWFKVETIGQVSKMFARNSDYIWKKIKAMVDDFEIDIVSSNVIFKNMCYGELLYGKYSDDQVRSFLAVTMHDEAKIERQIKQIRG